MFHPFAAVVRVFVVILISLLTSWSVQGQSILLFDAKEIDLGYIPEDTGNLVVTFLLKNTSNKAGIIRDIDTHGGCSIMSYPKDSIPAGGRDKITVKLNPKNRPGPFVRKITLLSMPDSVSQELLIKSYVEPVTKVWDENTNETKYGNVLLSSDYIRLGSIPENTKLERSLKIKNTGKETVKFVASKFKKPAYVTLRGLPDKLLAGEQVTVVFVIDFAAANKLGNYSEMIELHAEPGMPKEVIVYLMGKLIPANANNANKPIVQMLLKEANLNDIPSDKPSQGNFVIKNTGQSPLVFRKVESSCACLHLDQTNPIVAGESATVYFTFDPRGLKGLEEKKIILYTNAPDQPIVTLLVKANVGP